MEIQCPRYPYRHRFEETAIYVEYPFFCIAMTLIPIGHDAFLIETFDDSPGQSNRGFCFILCFRKVSVNRNQEAEENRLLASLLIGESEVSIFNFTPTGALVPRKIMPSVPTGGKLATRLNMPQLLTCAVLCF